MENLDYEHVLKKLERKRRNSGILYALVPLSIIAIALFVFWTRLETRDKLLKEKSNTLIAKEKELNVRERRIHNLDSAIAVQDDQLFQINQEVDEYKGNATDTNSIVYQKIEQRNYADTAVARLQDNKSFNKNIKIEYYKQKSDDDKVIDALSQLGLVLKKDYDTLPSKIQHNLGPINSIKYGSAVDENSYQMVVLQLIKQGFDIRAVDPLMNSAGSENKIIIYRNVYVVNKPILNAEQFVKNPKDRQVRAHF